jgi:integrase
VHVASEGPVRITKTTVDAVWRRRSPGQRLVVRDAECRGLALVVNPSAMSWVFSYKPRGLDSLTGKRFPSKSVTIGGPASHSPEAARAEANRFRDRVKVGADPAAERRAKQAKDATQRGATVDRLVEVYAADFPKRPKMRGTGLPSRRYVVEEMASLRAAMAVMKVGGKPVAEVSTAELRALLKAGAGSSTLGRSRFGAVSRFLDWCLDEGHVPANVCASIGKKHRPKPPAARSRYLTPPQVALLWAAAEHMAEGVHRDFARFLLVIPCRRSEAARMDWAHVNLAGGAWSQPDKLTKNGEPHRFHLPALALDLLRARHEAAGEPAAGLVFPAPRSGRALTTFSGIKRELDRQAKLSDWAWHDLRRTFATALGEAGVSEVVADAVLNHRQAATRSGVLGVYQRAERMPERRAAMEAWASILGAAIKGRPAADGATDLVAARVRRAAELIE